MRGPVSAFYLSLLVVLCACGREPDSATDTIPETTNFETAAAKSVPGVAIEATVQIDPVTGFKMNRDWELVRAHCTGCHSSKLITQQRGTPQQWLAMIRWMQKKQNLWQFDPGTESRIIAYLSENYPPDEARRRAAIPRALMPPNPYTDPTQQNL